MEGDGSIQKVKEHSGISWNPMESHRTSRKVIELYGT